jgi:hypothetical protein
MKAIYDASDNSLTEQPESKKPVESDYDKYSNEFESRMFIYNAQLEKCRKIPCSPEAVNSFRHGEVYEEGSDYEIETFCQRKSPNCGMLSSCSDCRISATPSIFRHIDSVPHSSKSADPFPELLSRIATLFSEGKGNEEIAGVLREEYLITKK